MFLQKGKGRVKIYDIGCKVRRRSLYLQFPISKHFEPRIKPPEADLKTTCALRLNAIGTAMKRDAHSD